MATKCLIKFLSRNHVFSQTKVDFLSINKRRTHACPLKAVVTNSIDFRHRSLKGDPRFATKTLVCTAQSVISGYNKAEVL